MSMSSANYHPATNNATAGIPRSMLNAQTAYLDLSGVYVLACRQMLDLLYPCCYSWPLRLISSPQILLCLSNSN